MSRHLRSKLFREASSSACEASFSAADHENVQLNNAADHENVQLNNADLSAELLD